MANNKTGFDYYATDTNRYQDIKIKRLKKDFSATGVSVFDYILNEIYRLKGCYIEWDDSIAFDVAEYWGIKESAVNEIVNYCCHVGLFNKGLFTSGRVLTSVAIQKRYVDWCLKARRVNIRIPDDVILLTPQNAGILFQNVNILDDNVVTKAQKPNSLPQSKVNQSKLKESSSTHARTTTQTTTPTFDDFFNFFKEKSSWSDRRCKEKATKIFNYYDWTITANWQQIAENWIDTEIASSQSANKGTNKFPGHPDSKFVESLGNEDRKLFFKHLSDLGWSKANGQWVKKGEQHQTGTDDWMTLLSKKIGKEK